VPTPPDVYPGTITGFATEFAPDTEFGDAVRSKTDTAMVNEALCKLLAHNLCVLIQEEHELGIESVFWPCGTNGTGAIAV
jgi:hypothetical protein